MTISKLEKKKAMLCESVHIWRPENGGTSAVTLCTRSRTRELGNGEYRPLAQAQSVRSHNLRAENLSSGVCRQERS